MLCVCSKKGEVLAGGVVSKEVRGSSPVLQVEEEREQPAVTDLQVVVVETFHEKGSLKDFMLKVNIRTHSRSLTTPTLASQPESC